MSSPSSSPGSEPKGLPTGLTGGEVRALAKRHGIHPTKKLGQNFLVDPNLARRIAGLAEIGPQSLALEIGAGVGSLTVALAATGARVVAIEFDRQLLPALGDAVAPFGDRVQVVEADATTIDWSTLLGDRRATMVSNLPYNVGTGIVVGMLEQQLPIDRYLVMVQREVGERLAATAGQEAYGAVSARVAWFAEAHIERRIPRTVFWPEPSIESVLVSFAPHAPPPAPGVTGPGEDVGESEVFRVVEAGFAQRRKTMRSALRRLGEPALTTEAAEHVLARCGLAPSVRAEELSLREFVQIAAALAEVRS